MRRDEIVDVRAYVVGAGAGGDYHDREKGHHFDLGEVREVDLGDYDVVLMRQDPPFDMHYITSTHLLDRLAAHGDGLELIAQ